ncbi:MAG: preprotein translocase subunit SecG [Betaproteobacteria bacterium]|jgi:preprotein translocase subunit SecG
MELLKSILIVIQVISAICVIVLVLVQQGKGADMGAAFGSGASGSIFGATGSSNFLSRTTAVLAAIFFVTTLSITYIGSHPSSDIGVLGKQSGAPVTQVDSVPSNDAVKEDASKIKEDTSKTNSIPK